MMEGMTEEEEREKSGVLRPFRLFIDGRHASGKE